MTALELHVDPHGSHAGDASRSRPLRTLQAAFARLREQRSPDMSAVIWLHDGVHYLSEPLHLGPQDSHTTIAAWPGATPVVDGGRRIEGWTVATLHGREVWCAPAPVRCGRALFVQGQRAARPRLPRRGSWRMVKQPGADFTADAFEALFDGSATAVVEPADIAHVSLIDGLELVVPHFWTQERMPVIDIDHAVGRLTSSRHSIFALRDGMASEPARWWLEGVGDALGEEPGEWLLDSVGELPLDGDALPPAPRIVYAPTAHDRIDHLDAVVPVNEYLLVVEGTAEFPVRDIRIDGVTFRHAEWSEPPEARLPFGIREDPVLPDVAYASDNQAACTVPGAITMSFAHQCSMTNSRVERVGGFGIRLGDGVRNCLVSGVTVRDTGAGSIACGGAANPTSVGATRSIEISDCELVEGGRIYPQAAAVLVRHAAQVHVLHNEISDHPSTGIAVGWRWDYGPSAAVDNLIEGNHLHRLGGGEVDWFGAVYTLGVSPGTRIRRNLIHGVRAPRFGGWALLIDPASSELVIEENVIHDVSAECVHIKTGRDNTLRRNILAHGGTGLISLAAVEPHVSATLSHNVLIPGPMPVYSGAPGSLTADAVARSGSLRADSNIVYGGSQVVVAGDVERRPGGWHVSADNSGVWRDSGCDNSSVVINDHVSIQADGSLSVTGTELDQHGAWNGQDIAAGPRGVHRRTSHPSLDRSRS